MMSLEKLRPQSVAAVDDTLQGVAIWSEWRFAHKAPGIHLPRTINGAEPTAVRSAEGLRNDYIEAGFTHLDDLGMSHGCTRYNADTLRGFWYGA